MEGREFRFFTANNDHKNQLLRSSFLSTSQLFFGLISFPQISIDSLSPTSSLHPPLARRSRNTHLDSNSFPLSSLNLTSRASTKTMSSAAAVDSATAQMASTTLNEPATTAEGASVGAGGDKPINAANNEAVIASAAEGRRLYIGNLAYATTEGELKDFFKDYLVYVHVSLASVISFFPPIGASFIYLAPTMALDHNRTMTNVVFSETVSIPTNPRTTRPVGYAFVDLSTPSEADRAISELSNQTILDRKVSVQLARKPDEQAGGTTSGGEGADGTRRRNSGRGRGRGRGRGGRAARGGRVSQDPISTPNEIFVGVKLCEHTLTVTQTLKSGDAGGAATNGATSDGPTNVPGQVLPLTDTTQESLTAAPGTEGAMDVPQEKTTKNGALRERRQRGPPEDGIPSKNKVMVANLPYDLREEKVF